MKKLEVMNSFFYNIHKCLFIYKIRRSEVFGVGIEPWRTFGDCSCIAIAIITDLLSDFTVNYFEGIVKIFFATISLSIDVDSASFKNVDSFISQRLINKVIRRKKTMN